MGYSKYFAIAWITIALIKCQFKVPRFFRANFLNIQESGQIFTGGTNRLLRCSHIDIGETGR